MTTAKVMLTATAIAFSHVLGLVAAVLDLLPDRFEDVGGEILLIAALLGLLRLTVKRTWKFVCKANHAYDVLMGVDERHARNETHLESIDQRLGRGDDRMGRLEDRSERMEQSLDLLADEERQLIVRRLHAALPERRTPPTERRDPPPAERRD